MGLAKNNNGYKMVSEVPSFWLFLKDVGIVNVPVMILSKISVQKFQGVRLLKTCQYIYNNIFLGIT